MAAGRADDRTVRADDRHGAAHVRRRGIAPSDVDIISLHDLCSSEEVLTLVELGIGEPDAVIRLALDGELDVGGRLPTNIDGGCVARGHPSGATR